MTPDERAVYSYAGCFYIFAKYNQSFVKKMIEEFTRLEKGSKADPSYLKKMPDAVVNLTHHICSEFIKGKGVDYSKMDDETITVLTSVSSNIVHNFVKYGDIIEAIAATPILPPNLANIKTMIRKVTVLSDTDSTCTTYQDWVKFYFGDYKFGPDALSVAAFIMILTTESVGHQLRVYSATMNVPQEHMDKLDMKNEYTWISMTPASVSKHYFADTIVREGAVFKDTVLELKGRHLIASDVPTVITDFLDRLIKDINRRVATNEPIPIDQYLQEVIDLENTVLAKIIEGDPDYFTTGKINISESYKHPVPRNPYIRHIFWNDTFGKHYTMSPEPPYITISIKTKLDTKAKTRQWLDTMKNKNLAKDIETFLKTYNKNTIPTVFINVEILDGGIPKELLEVMDYTSGILKMMNSIYLVLEMLGIYKRPTMMLKEMMGI